MIIRVSIGNNVDRKTVQVDDTSTLRSVIEENGFNPNAGFNLSGRSLVHGDIDKTFADFGVDEYCSLMATQKADNA